MVAKIQLVPPHVLLDVAPARHVLPETHIEARFKATARLHFPMRAKRPATDVHHKAAERTGLVFQCAADFAAHCTIPALAGIPAGCPGVPAAAGVGAPVGPAAAACAAICILSINCSTCAIAAMSRSLLMP